VKDVSEFYLDFAKFRRRRLTHGAACPSTLHVLSHLLNTLLTTAAPVLPFTAQEAFDHLPATSNKPPTVFHLPWHL
jgi:isoleucyl-tRNA synthetase